MHGDPSGLELRGRLGYISVLKYFDSLVYKWSRLQQACIRRRSLREALKELLMLYIPLKVYIFSLVTPNRDWRNTILYTPHMLEST
jgi:hypothetical protein